MVRLIHFFQDLKELCSCFHCECSYKLMIFIPRPKFFISDKPDILSFANFPALKSGLHLNTDHFYFYGDFQFLSHLKKLISFLNLAPFALELIFLTSFSFEFVHLIVLWMFEFLIFSHSGCLLVFFQSKRKSLWTQESLNRSI